LKPRQLELLPLERVDDLISFSWDVTTIQKGAIAFRALTRFLPVAPKACTTAWRSSIFRTLRETY